MAPRQPLQSGWNNIYSVDTVANGRDHQAQLAEGPLATEQVSWGRRLKLLWLMGVMVLLPLDLIRLPFSVTPVDLWILMALPMLWFSFLRGPQVISLSYTVAMLLILVSSFASTFGAPAPRNSLIVILKEVYVFIWFITLAAVFAGLNAKESRRVLLVWCGAVFLHGFVIIGQFLSPEFWRIIVSFAGRLREFEFYRPSGLFMNANSAAFFQLLGFVPLLLVSPSQKVGMFWGLLLLPTMLVTGSMGAALAFAAAVAIGIFALLLSGKFFLIVKMFMQLAIAIVLCSGILYIVLSHNERYQQHFAHIFLGRAERSSEGRFDLWLRGLDVFIERGVLLWGVGPENFREVDAKLTDNQLHNDFLAFSVERGLLGALGLALFATLAVSRAAYMILICHKYPDRAQLTVVVFLGAMIAAMVESLTHQIFHFRTLWLVLALQEAMLFQMTASQLGVEPLTRLQNGPPRYHGGFVTQMDVPEGSLQKFTLNTRGLRTHPLNKKGC